MPVLQLRRHQDLYAYNVTQWYVQAETGTIWTSSDPQGNQGGGRETEAEGEWDPPLDAKSRLLRFTDLAAIAAGTICSADY